MCVCHVCELSSSDSPVRAASSDVLSHLRHNIQLQGEDFAMALDVLEDEVQRFGPAPPPPVSQTGREGVGHDTTPPSARQNPADHAEWVLTQGRALLP